MSAKIKYLVIVLGVFMAGFLFSIGIKPGQVAAGNTSKLRDGNAVIRYNWPNEPDALSVEIPEGVALTDLTLYPIANTLLPAHCNIDIVAVYPSGQLLSLEELLQIVPAPSQNDPTQMQFLPELHLESGLRSDVDRKIELRLHPGSPSCLVFVLWTGYEY